MKKEDIVKSLVDKLEAFAKETSALDTVGTETKKEFTYKIIYKIIALEFVYNKKERMGKPASLLYCRVYLQKNSDIFYHFPELMKYLNLEDFRNWYYPYIESEERLTNCLNTLTGMIKEYLSKILDIALSKEELIKIENEIIKERIFMFKNGKEPKAMENEEWSEYLLWMQEFQEKFVWCYRYTACNAYTSFLEGDYEKALVQYEKLLKKDIAPSYEYRLMEFIKMLKEKNEKYEAIPSECYTIAKGEKYKGLKPLWLLKMILIVWIFLSICYVTVIAAINSFMKIGAIMVAGMEWYYGIVFALLPAIFCGMAYRKQICKVFMPKQYEEMCNFEDILSSRGEEKFVKFIANISIVGVALWLLVILQMSAIICDDHIMYDSCDKMIQKNVRYDYKDIENIYHVEGRYNDYGDWIKRESYIIEFKNSERIDLDGITSVEKTEKVILPLLSEYVSEVINIKSEEDILE